MIARMYIERDRDSNTEKELHLTGFLYHHFCLLIRPVKSGNRSLSTSLNCFVRR